MARIATWFEGLFSDRKDEAKGEQRAQASWEKRPVSRERRDDTFASINMQIWLTLIIRKLRALFDVARLTAPLVYEQRAASRRVLGCSVVRWYYYQDQRKWTRNELLRTTNKSTRATSSLSLHSRSFTSGEHDDSLTIGFVFNRLRRNPPREMHRNIFKYQLWNWAIHQINLFVWEQWRFSQLAKIEDKF